jgi:phage replication O-like protein O
MTLFIRIFMGNTKFRGFRSPNTTAIPDEVFDELMAELTGAELKVLLYICRRTFGFKKEKDNISLHQLVEGITTKKGNRLDGGTGLGKASVARAIKSLEAKEIILRIKRQSKRRGDEATTYALNFLPVSQNETPPVAKMRHPRVSKVNPQQTVGQQTVGQQTYKNVWQKPVINKDQDQVEYYAQLLAERLDDAKSLSYYRIVCARHNPDKLLQKAAEIVKDGQAKKPAAVFTSWVQSL